MPITRNLTPCKALLHSSSRHIPHPLPICTSSFPEQAVRYRAALTTVPRYPLVRPTPGYSRLRISRGAEGGRGSPYYASHADMLILSTSSGLHSPLSVDSSSFSQYQSPASTYQTEHNPFQVAGTTVAVINTHYQSPMAMVSASFPPTTAQLPYASVSTSLPLVSNDLSAEAPEPTTTKKRKVKDARQIRELNRVYSRTAYPSTEKRQQLARDLNLTPRCVQVWLVHLFIPYV
jgi:homeobox protein YOX1/YHP1